MYVPIATRQLPYYLLYSEKIFAPDNAGVHVILLDVCTDYVCTCWYSLAIMIVKVEAKHLPTKDPFCFLCELHQVESNLTQRRQRSRHKLGDELVEAYAGPDEGVQTMKASEWQPFIRTMPHSEYPSGSACLCTVGSSLNMQSVFGL